MLKRTIAILLLIFLTVLLFVAAHIADNTEYPAKTDSIETTETTTTAESEKPKLEPDSTLPAPESEPVSEPTQIPEYSYLEKVKKWEKDHYYATKVWEFLRLRGFSQEVTCGIIGNMMVETSGGTLDLNPTIYSLDGNFYGLCQWHQEYYPETKDLSFESQLGYLLETMPQEFSTFGELYEENFDYEDFLKIKDPSEAALVFAKVYERCRPASYELRQEAAQKAYEYFNLNY